MTIQAITTALAERVMGWRVGPDRFLIGQRRWMPHWRFQPVERIEDTFRLLEQLSPKEYAMRAAEDGSFWARVVVGGVTGEARELTQARALTLAIARAVGLKVEEE